VSAVATAHPIKPRKSLKTFLSGFSCAGEGGVRVARKAVYEYYKIYDLCRDWTWVPVETFAIRHLRIPVKPSH